MTLGLQCPNLINYCQTQDTTKIHSFKLTLEFHHLFIVGKSNQFRSKLYAKLVEKSPYSGAVKEREIQVSA